MKTQKQQQAEFERISNAPSPNPRYAGLSVIEATRSLDTSGRNDQRPIQHLILARGGAHPSAKSRKSGFRDAAIMGRARSCWTGFIEVRPECELYDQLMAHETLAKVIERSAPGFQYHFKAVTGTPQIQFWKQLQLQEEARPLEGMLCLPCSEPGGSTLVATAANQPAKTFRSALSQHSGHQIHPL